MSFNIPGLGLFRVCINGAEQKYRVKRKVFVLTPLASPKNAFVLFICFYLFLVR